MSPRGGVRRGSGRKKGVPMPHLRNPQARIHNVTVCVSAKELRKLERSSKPLGLRLYEYAVKGGL